MGTIVACSARRRSRMKPIHMAFALAMLSATGLVAQTVQTEKKTTTRTTVKDGKDVTLTGCLTMIGDRYMLTNAADKKGAVNSYTLVSDGENLSKHVGRLVQIHGKVTDRGDAKVEIESKTQTKVENGEDRTTRTKAEIRGDDAPSLLGVSSIKTIAGACQ